MTPHIEYRPRSISAPGITLAAFTPYGEFVAFRAFANRVADRATVRHDPFERVIVFNLTYPTEWEIRRAFFPSGFAFAQHVGEMGETIWLLAEVDAAGHLHWHGLTISARHRDWWRREWAEFVGAKPGKDAVKLVEGQRDRYSKDFRIELARSMLYRRKDQPHIYVPLDERAVAAGFLAEDWTATGHRLADPNVNPYEHLMVARAPHLVGNNAPSTSPQVPSFPASVAGAPVTEAIHGGTSVATGLDSGTESSGSGARPCASCGKPLGKFARKGKKHCNRTCALRAWREARPAKKAWEREQVELGKVDTGAVEAAMAGGEIVSTMIETPKKRKP